MADYQRSGTRFGKAVEVENKSIGLTPSDKQHIERPITNCTQNTAYGFLTLEVVSVAKLLSSNLVDGPNCEGNKGIQWKKGGVRTTHATLAVL
jgi:hypothetical protein